MRRARVRSALLHVARDEHAMHLRRALVDPHDPQLRGHQVERHLPRHSHRTEGLLGVVDDFGGHLGREYLQHGSFGPRFLAARYFFGRVVGHQPRRVNLRRGVRDPPLDGLPFGERNAEGFALRHVLDHHVQRPLRAAGADGADLHAAGRETQLHRAVAVAFLPEQLGFRHPAVVERQLVGRAPADHRDLAQDGESRRVLVHDEGRDAAARALLRVGHRHDDHEVRARHAAHPDLAPVDDPAAARPLPRAFSCSRGRRRRSARKSRWRSGRRRARRARGIAAAAPRCRLSSACAGWANRAESGTAARSVPAPRSPRSSR